MSETHLSSTEFVRNLRQIAGPIEILYQLNDWQVVRLPTIYWNSDLWAVNPLGYLWEAFETVEAAIAYVDAGDYDDEP